jgi:hypothetical protein
MGWQEGFIVRGVWEWGALVWVNVVKRGGTGEWEGVWA